MNLRSISFRIIILAFFSLFVVSKASATHIIGGEITYSCLGNNLYEIKLTVFRDCYNGVPYFDDTVSIGIFNYENDLIYDIRTARSNDDTIHQTLVGTCLAIPGNVCVHTSVYTDTVELKPILGGYTLVYQRCCRNKTIANIVAPDETGASFVINITEKALLECNSSPKFKDWPPIYICANVPINYDHSAVDKDGDSIVYKLCTPINGVGMNPQPQPPYNPPYNNVVWKDPPYNLNNLLGGIPLSIDSKTGLLTGTPNTIGQFVVGICIEEYRDGELISTTTRDFQYNVGICTPTASGFFAPDINCDTLTVAFSNQSISADVFFWDFGDPTTTNDVSNAYSPSYHYPAPGTYHVTLIAQAGDNEMCRDTFEKDIQVLLNTMIPDFKIKVLSCTDTLKVQFTDSSVDTSGNAITSWKYYFRVGGKLIDSSSLKTAVFSYSENTSTWSISLVVENALGCSRQRTKNIVFPKIIKFNFPADTLIKCYNDTLFIPATLDTLNYSYTWTPDIYMSNPDSGKLYNTAPVSTEYLFSIKDNKSVCHLERKLYIKVPPIIELDIPDTLNICTKDISIPVITNNPDLQIKISEDPSFGSVIDSGYTIDLKNIKGTHKYYISAIDTAGCEIIDSLTVIGNAIFIDSPDLSLLCPGDSKLLNIKADTGQILTYTWTPNIELVVNNNEAIANPVGAGLHTYYFQITNNLGCTLNDSISLFVIDTSQGEFLYYQQCAGTKLLFQGVGINKDYYHWEVVSKDTSYFFDSSEFAVIFPDTGYYLVKAWLPEIVCIDTLTKLVHVDKSVLFPDFQSDVSNCIDSLSILFTNSTKGFDPGLHDIHWVLSNGILSSMDSLALIFNTIDSSLEVYLIIDQNNGCLDTIVKSYYISYIPSIPDDTIIICKGQEIQLNNSGVFDWINYYWTPEADFTDNTLPNPSVNPIISTSYIAHLTNHAIDSFICTSQFKVIVNVLEKPSYSLSYDSVICNQSTLLSIDTDTSGLITWFDNNNFNNPKATGPNWLVEPDRLSYYYATIHFPNGCSDTITLKIINQLPQIEANKIFLCEGDTALLNVKNLLTEDSLVCVWEPSSLIITDPVTGLQYVSAVTDLELKVSCTNQYGCSITDTVAVDIFNYKPPLTVTSESDTIFFPNGTQLTATNDPGYTYYWSPPNGLNATNIYNPVANPTVTTEYKVQIVNEDGCRNEAFLRIVVLNVNCEEPFSFIPNAFSPNGDGKNDVFMLRGDFIKSVDLKVYNRWGEKVFETLDKNQGWDGTYKGELLGPDVYGYYIEFICEDGLHFIKKGNVSIIR